MTKIKIALLVVDEKLYPRNRIDETHIRQIEDAIRADTELPAIVVEKRSNRIVDGVHRHEAYNRVFGEDHAIPCILKSYDSEADIILDAIRLNAPHGRRMSNHDRVVAVIRAEELGASRNSIAEAMSLTLDRLEEIIANRDLVDRRGEHFAGKQTVAHLARSQVRLTKKQREAVKKVGGHPAGYYVNQIINLIENDLINKENGNLKERLTLLAELLPNIAWAV